MPDRRLAIMASRAFATLTIFEGNKVVADYTAKAHVSKSYNLYSEPKHSEAGARRA